ncbi:MAG: AAA family ATPase [Candidatus Micrarchaeota archaeon]|nr:AAA family ATPase [Candidatus Micrarchaeota archaeon]
MAAGKGKNDSKPQTNMPPPEAKELYDQAGKLFEENKFDEAIELYSQAIEKYPEYSSAYFNRALSYALKSEYEKGINDAMRVMELEPNAADAPYVMGVISEYQNDLAGAQEWYEKSLKSNPNYQQAKDRLKMLKDKMKGAMAGGKMKTAAGAEGTETVVEEGQIKKVAWFTSDMTFKDVVGMEKQKQIIHDNIVLAITKPELLRAYGKKLGLGVIFYGPPGGGKTYLVRAIAGETKAKFIIMHINEIVDMYAGNTEKNLHAIFEQARKNAPCIVFADEIDALGTKREGEQQGNMRMAVNQFLQELDGVEKNPEGIFIIGATNQPWDMDPALKRPGRFGESVYIPAPKYKERREAFKYNTRSMPLSKFVGFGRLARATWGFSMADVFAICDKAALKVAAEEDRTGKKRMIGIGDFIAIIKSQGSSLDEWYGMVKKDVISKTETQIVEGKKQEIVKEGRLSPEEKVRYKPMIKDIKKNLNPVNIFVKKVMRFWAIYLF